MSKSAQPAIVFDVGNVLLDWRPDRFFLGLIGEGDRLDTLLRDVIPLSWHVEQDRGRPIAEAVIERQALYPDFAEEIAAFYDRWLETIAGPIAGMEALFDALIAAGYPLHAITNFSAELWPRTVEVYPFLSRFDVAIVSGAERLIKPDPRIFHILLERTGLAAGECLFIDDRAENVDAAKALGFDGLQFIDAPSLRQALAARGILA